MEKALAIQKQVIDILGTDKVYLVGGSVRDLVMGHTPKDYDFCTPMLPEEMEEAVKKAGRHVYGIGKKFGTIGFKVPLIELQDVVDLGEIGVEMDGKPLHSFEVGIKKEFEYVEVTTFRSEVYTSKSRKPEVKFVPSLEEDLARRDFTMNAMVLRPDGTIYDPYGGKLDIHARMIKSVGIPKARIMEDPLRMLRAARFAARYGFEIDANFIGKARHLADRIYDVSVERWVQELDKLITARYAPQAWQALVQMGLAQRILPEVSEPLFMKDQSADASWSFLLSNLHENQKTNRYVAGGICQRLKFSNDRTDITLGVDKRK